MALSEAWLKSKHKKLSEKSEEKTDRDGMSVRVSPKGKITFQMRFRYEGKAARLDLGSYPLISLKEAREKALEMRAKLEQGYDPRIVKKIERQSISQAVSLEGLFTQWYNSYCIKNKKNHHEIKRSFELYVFKEIGMLPLGDISIHQWLTILEKLVESGRPSISARILTNTKQMTNWGIRRQLVVSNVLANINAKQDLQITKNKTDRTLSDEEIHYVLKAIDHSRMAPKNKIFLKLCLCFACRNGELRLSKKEHFDFDKRIWTVPPENHKSGQSTGKPLLRPIIPEFEPLIKEAFDLSGKSQYLFNNSGTNEPMGTSSPLALPYNVMQWLRKNEGYDMMHWTVHDLRRTARTNLSTLAPPHIAEIILGHKLPGEWATYDRHDYLEEQAEAYRKWWDRLEGIIVK
ncbi:tyrosine-type recombinase/integrase [Marinomonas sp. PE14-40]|uniref:tyrosine-type recombinase/integrase n=1 Tax=Marinomonas sp. PE14-40 TaxID=3060621 RepID=UPI003F678EE9